jgi:integrase
MARRLSARAIQSESVVGYHADADQRGLYLQVTNGSGGIERSWVFRFVSPVTRKRRDMGLGSTRDVGLAEARQRATTARSILKNGLDPIEERRKRQIERRIEAARAITFDAAAEACIKAKAPEWSNSKHAAQWTTTLTTYASPHIGGMPVSDVTVDDVLRILEPIWTTKTETATRVRQRIETVLDWSAARGYRFGLNPASLKGNLAQLLPRPSKIKRVEHHPALPFKEVNRFVTSLRQRPGVSAIALEFLILTAARTGEVINASWSEIDLTEKLWTIPASRMKAKREHRVPLCNRACQILVDLKATATSDYIFPGQSLRQSKPMSSAAMLELIRGINAYKTYVPHGFRSTFRDWASETTNHSHETIELALAHAIRNKVEAAYRRGDLLNKRRNLMEAWAAYVEATPRDSDSRDNVYQIRKAQ